jgi:hypothetical protein
MSQGRPDDLRKTIEELRNPSGIIDGKNWLRHGEGKQDQRIDEMLLIGATKQDIARDLIQKGLSKRDLQITIQRVQRHIDHIRKEEHKIPLNQDENGVWRFNVGAEVEESSNNSIDENKSLKKNYYPTRQDFEAAYKALARPWQEVPVDKILDQIESNIKGSGYALAEDWRIVIIRNIGSIWSLLD